MAPLVSNKAYDALTVLDILQRTPRYVFCIQRLSTDSEPPSQLYASRQKLSTERDGKALLGETLLKDAG